MHVRRAAEIVDAAVGDRSPSYVRPGRTELEIAAQLNSVMAELRRRGARHPHHGLGRAGRLVPHPLAARSRRPVERGDVMYVDCCGVVDRYHVDVCRTFAIGRDHPRRARDPRRRPRGSVEP